VEWAACIDVVSVKSVTALLVDIDGEVFPMGRPLSVDKTTAFALIFLPCSMPFFGLLICLYVGYSLF
jgi:hypothetical protein